MKTHEWGFSVFLVRVLLFSQMTSLMTILEDYFNWKGNIIACGTSVQTTSFEPRKEKIYLKINFSGQPVLSVRFEVGVSLLLAPAGADKRGPKVSLPLVKNVGIQPEIPTRVPAGASAGAGSC